MSNFESTRQNIAKYCANMLYGNHTRQQPARITIAHTLACVPFFVEEDRINLASRTCEFLSPLLEDRYILLDVTVIPEGDNHLRIEGEIMRR